MAHLFLHQSWYFVPAKVREIVESLQVQLQESEPLVADLQDIIYGHTTISWFSISPLDLMLAFKFQEKADSLEEKRVLLERKVARAERDRDIATVSELGRWEWPYSTGDHHTTCHTLFLKS